jgi:hypothetical protein
MWAVEYLWEQGEGVDVYTDPLEPPGGQGGGLHPRGEVVALAMPWGSWTSGAGPSLEEVRA